MNLATWIKGMPDALDLITGMAIAFPCIMGARLMINTRAHTPAWLNSGFSPSQASITIPRMAPPDGATGTIAGDAESGDGYDEYRLPIRSNSLRVPTDGLEEGNSGRMARTHVLQLQRSSSRGRYASGPDWHVLDTFCTNSNADGDAESIPAR
ncbi:hypothetical protein AX16_003002 [Volvariella volvacea WC 439]|nr:hypothetical protein AX16_003002 [Volvariella volvacea WC 439]